jgi:hypothetical protein
MYIPLGLITKKNVIHHKMFLILISTDKSFRLITCKSSKSIYDAITSRLNAQSNPITTYETIIFHNPCDNSNSYEIKRFKSFFVLYFGYGSVNVKKAQTLSCWHSEVIGLPDFDVDNALSINKKHSSSLACSAHDLMRLKSSHPRDTNLNSNVGEKGTKSILSGKRAEVIKELKETKSYDVREIIRLTDYYFCTTKGVFNNTMTPEHIFSALNQINSIIDIISTGVEKDQTNSEHNKQSLLRENLIGAISSQFFQDASWKYRIDENKLIDDGLVTKRSYDIDQVIIYYYIILYCILLLIYFMNYILVHCIDQNIKGMQFTSR